MNSEAILSQNVNAKQKDPSPNVNIQARLSDSKAKFTPYRLPSESKKDRESQGEAREGEKFRLVVQILPIDRSWKYPYGRNIPRSSSNNQKKRIEKWSMEDNKEVFKAFYRAMYFPTSLNWKAKALGLRPYIDIKNLASVRRYIKEKLLAELMTDQMLRSLRDKRNEDTL